MDIKKRTDILMNGFIAGSKNPVILGGHFALANDPKNRRAVIPAIFQEVQDEKVAEAMKHDPYMSYFPLETFQASLELLKWNSSAKLLLLVNDWQQVQDTDMPKAELRKTFYFYNKEKLPVSFHEMAKLKKMNIEQKIFRPEKENTYYNSMYWSESILRNKFKSAKYKSCSLKNACAQEFTPLLDFCEASGIDKMVAMIPATCAYPILEAVSEFKNIRDGKMDVMTVFFNKTTSLEEFWNVTASKNGKEIENL
jgi:hypothetical protein